MGPTHMGTGTGDRVAGKHLPASTVFGCILAPRFLSAVLQQLSPLESKHQEMEMRPCLPGRKRMGMFHLGLCWARGDQGTRSCCSLSLCCSPDPKRGRDITPLPPTKVTLAQRELGESRRECFPLERLAAPKSGSPWGCASAGQPCKHWQLPSPTAAPPRLTPGQTVAV